MAERNGQIFRQKALDKLSSPEQFNDYLQVTNPGVWAVLAVVIVMLAGLFAWAAIGNLETTVSAKAVIRDGTASITVTENPQKPLSADMTVRIGESEFVLSSLETDPEGNPVAYAPVTLADGSYDAKIVVESVSPISFLFKVTRETGK